MSDIGAPLSTGIPVAAAAETTAAALGQVTLSQLPDRLSLLTRPVLLSGTVTAQSPDGTTVLRTQAGPVAFNTTVPLPAETPVTLQISAGRPPTTANAFVTAPPTTAGAGSAPAALLPFPTMAGEPAVTTTLGSLAQAALSGTGTVPPSLLPGTVIPGQVLPSPGGRTGTGTVTAEAPQLVPGTTVAVRILSAAAPAALPPAGVPPAVLQTVTGTGTAPDLSGPPHPPTAEAPLGTASEPLAPQAPSPGKTALVMVTGTITGTTSGGQPILTTPVGTLALSTAAALAPGKTLTVELSDPRRLFADRPPPAAAGSGPGPQAWAPVREALAILTGQEGGLAQATLVATLPQPNRRLAAALTFALDAVRRGDARGWLGAETTAALEKAGRRDLLTQLDKEFRTQARQADDTPPGGWRPLAIPMLDAGMIQRIELYVRAVDTDEPDGRDGGAQERSQRFLLDLDLSRLGALQLDGLVRAKSKRFDLILRSLHPLPGPLRTELLGVFGKSLEAVGFSGGLGFQAGARGWVKPAAPAKAIGHRAVIA